MGTFLIIVSSQGILLVSVLQYKKKRREDQAEIGARLRQRHRRETGASQSNGASADSTLASCDVEKAESNVLRMNQQWDAFKDSVRTAFTVFIVCSTYITAFIFGAGLGTGLTLAYQEELKSCKVFIDLNLYMWTIVVSMYMTCFAANPYIYGLRNNDIKKEFKSMLAATNLITRARSIRQRSLRRQNVRQQNVPHTSGEQNASTSAGQSMPLSTFIN